MESAKATAIGGFPYFYIIQEPGTDQFKIWVYKPAISEEIPAIDREVIPKDGVISMKDEHGKIQFFKYQDVIDKYILAVAEKRIALEAKIEKREAARINPEILRQYRDLRMKVNDILAQCKHRDTTFKQLQDLKPSYEKAEQAVLDFEEDYPEVLEGARNRRELRPEQTEERDAMLAPILELDRKIKVLSEELEEFKLQISKTSSGWKILW